MVTAVSLLVDAISGWWNSINESEEDRYRREMNDHLNQAVDLRHLEYLEQEWDRRYSSRKYY